MGAMMRIPFHGDEILAAQDERGIWAAMRPMCEGLGVDYEAQHKRLRAQPWAETCLLRVRLPGDDQARDVFCLRSDRLAMWLATISVRRVRPELRAKLARYQTECAEVLDRHFRGDQSQTMDEGLHAVRGVVEQVVDARLGQVATSLTELTGTVRDLVQLVCERLVPKRRAKVVSAAQVELPLRPAPAPAPPVPLRTIGLEELQAMWQERWPAPPPTVDALRSRLDRAKATGRRAKWYPLARLANKHGGQCWSWSEADVLAWAKSEFGE